MVVPLEVHLFSILLVASGKIDKYILVHKKLIKYEQIRSNKPDLVKG